MYVIKSICPKDLRAGDVEEYWTELFAMLLAYHEGRYTDITNEIL